MSHRARKVVIIGAGQVGASFAYALMQSGLAEEIVLIDRNSELANGQTLDLVHGLPFVPPVQVRVGTAADYTDAALIVVAAGAAQRPNESRLQLLNRNAAIMTSITDNIVAQNPQGVILVVSNPVDVLTHVALRHSDLPKGRIIGSGTVLDSARFRTLLSRHCQVDARNVHAYILGEHGDSEVAAWSMTHIAGMPIAEYCIVCGQCAGWQDIQHDISEQVRQSAYHIIGYKGATYYAIGLAMTRIASAVLRNERSVLTVSTLLEGEFDLHNVCLGVPAIVGAAGVERVVEGRLTADELTALQNSARVLQQTMADLDSSQPG